MGQYRITSAPQFLPIQNWVWWAKVELGLLDQYEIELGGPVQDWAW